MPGKKQDLFLNDLPLDSRTSFALQSVAARDERRIANTSVPGSAIRKRIADIGAFARINILGDPCHDMIGVGAIQLSIPMKTTRTTETLMIRVRDPAVPSRIWNQFTFEVSGFDKGFARLNLTIDCRDLVLTGGDRLWVDIGANGQAQLLFGDPTNPAEMVVREVPPKEAVDAYAEKEMISAQAQYRMNYEFMIWHVTGREVSLEAPYCYGGPFDMILPALAVRRVKPSDFLSRYLTTMSGPDYLDGRRRNPKKVKLITIPDSTGAPRWALYMKDYNTKRWAMAQWWADRQNTDGEIGGGWNDDVLFARGWSDLALDGHAGARNLVDNVYRGIDNTRLFANGFCNIHPMDLFHTGDFIREQYSTVMNNLGSTHPMIREMASAWRLDKPDSTPINYFAKCFEPSATVIKWYWQKFPINDTYHSVSLDSISKELQLYSSLFDDIAFYRLTSARVHTDDYTPYGSERLYSFLLGSPGGTIMDARVNIAVAWPKGGGPDLSRVVLEAGPQLLKVAAYSFRDQPTDLHARLYKLVSGRYRIGIYEDPSGSGTPGELIWSTEKDLKRFDVVEWKIPPRKPVVIVVELIRRIARPSDLPDLATDPN